ncbi:MAG: alpha/beta hydrolase [Turicibacter sp.]|nr:alpha/beta hydrolase [Turicibacter sp.]
MISKQTDTQHIKRKWLDVAYATQSDAQKLDIYLPETGEGPFPVILSIHGGAFKMGDKRDFQLRPMLEGLKRGYAVVGINYRLSGEALFPANIYDVKAAVRFIKANANQFKLDPNKMVAWGGSAGGYLSTLLATSSSFALEDLKMGNEQEDCKVQAVVDWFGPTDFLKMDEQLKEANLGPQDHNDADSPESLVLGAQITTIPNKVKEANPITYITKDVPPFFIQHGSVDNIVPNGQSKLLYEALVAAGHQDQTTLEYIEGASHGGPQFETKENLDKVFRFIDTYLK